MKNYWLGSHKCLLVSPVQSLLVSDSVETHDQISIRCMAVYMFINWVSCATEAPCLFYRNFARVYLHSHCVQVRAFPLYGYHTRFVTLQQCITFMQDIHRISLSGGFYAAGGEFTYFHTPKLQLVTWTVIGLAAAKFKPLYFLCMTSLCPFHCAFGFRWFWMNYACFLPNSIT
jgi:hypothetical protein